MVLDKNMVMDFSSSYFFFLFVCFLDDPVFVEHASYAAENLQKNICNVMEENCENTNLSHGIVAC